MLDLFMTLTSKFQTAIAAETITCLQFALTNRKGKETLKARYSQIHARQHLKCGAASAQNCMQIAEHIIQASASA